MADLIAELAEVVRLSERATDGEWRTDYRKTARGHYSQEVFDARGATIATLAWHCVPLNATTTTTDREPNAQFITALVNWFRTHHAEIEANERDAARYRWLRDRVYWKPLPDGLVGKIYLVATMVSAVYGNTDDQTNEAIDAAMHDSAREDSNG